MMGPEEVAPHHMRIAIYQGPGRAGDTASNLARMVAAAADAARAGAGLLVFPEVFVSGYNIGAAALARAAQAADGPAAERLAAAARETGVALLYGYAERAGDAVYNAAQLIDGRGERLANHRKSHLFGDLDRVAFTAGGGEPVLADLDGWRAGILICYDVEFPENLRRLARAGAELILVPTALPRGPYAAFIATQVVPVRAFENQVFVAYANHTGSDPLFNYAGLSRIAAPDGRCLAAADDDAAALLFADIDPAAYGNSRAANTYLRDLRTS